MKKICLTLTMAVSLLSICSIGVQAQKTQPKLNQVELMKQFFSTWQNKISDDTTYTYSIEPFGIGGVGWSKTTTDDKTLSEGRVIIGYDPGTDKIRWASMKKGKELVFRVAWFSSDTHWTHLDPLYVSNPEMAPFRIEGDFKSQDMYVENIIINNKIAQTKTWTRVK
jgi:hypothetical protein